MTRKDNIANHARFLILSISSHCVKTQEIYDVTKLLKLLVKNSTSTLRTSAKNLLINRDQFFNCANWHYTICWQLSLDKEENLALF